MAGVYRPRHPERSVLYRVLFHHFDRFLTEYESRFEREYGFFRPIVKEVVEKYLDCGNPKCGFARIRCPDCAEERLVMFSCRTRGFCPSCHAKRIDDSRLTEIFAREVLAMLVRKELLSPEWAERILSGLTPASMSTATYLSPG